MIKYKVKVIRWRMVIIQNFFKSVEVILLVEYIIPLFIIYGLL